ncbi:MAG: hypothetical protein ABI903_04770 [Actinomycetota bacterium]
MNRTAPAHSTKGHLGPRTTILSGAALGLVVGAAVYGAVSSSAGSPVPTAFKAKAPVALAPATAPGCAGTATLEKGVCVVHVVRTVIAPPVAPVPAATAAAVPVAGQVPTSTVRPGASAGGSAAAPKKALAPKAPATPVVVGTKAPATAPIAAVAPRPTTSPTTAPVPGSTPSPTITPVPTAAS